jgi:ribonuclease D
VTGDGNRRAEARTVHDVAGAAALDELAARLVAAPVASIDLEADALHAFRPRLCYLQIAVDDRIDLVDALSPGVRLATLAQPLTDAKIRKIVHAAAGDLEYLASAGLRLRGLFDTHRAVTLLGWPRVGLADLARELLGVELVKAHQQADFARRPLPPALRQYIADDVRYLPEIGERVLDACREADILEEVELDCRRLEAEAAERPAAPAFAPKLPPSVTGMRRAEALAVGRGLHERRLAWAEAADLPTGLVLSNAALNALALHPPRRLEDFKRMPGVRESFIRRYGAEALSEIQRALERARTEAPADAPPTPAPVDRARKRREEDLKTFRAVRARERGVTPAVVLPSALLADLVARPPASLGDLAAHPYFGEKRLQLYGESILRTLQGAG